MKPETATLIVLFLTGCVIAWQAYETRRYANAAIALTESNNRQFKLLNQQWLDVSYMRVQAMRPKEYRATDLGYIWEVRFKIENHTPLPARIRNIEVLIEGGITTVWIPRTLTPNSAFKPRIEATDVADVTLARINAGKPMSVAVTGRIAYLNALGEQAEQFFGRRGNVSSFDRTRLTEAMPAEGEAYFRRHAKQALTVMEKTHED